MNARLAGEVHVWLLRTGAWPRPTGGALDVLDSEERRIGSAFVREADRVRYEIAHVARRTLLGRYLGVPPASIVFMRAPCPLCGGPHGRPELAGGGPQFSLSHSGDLVAIAVAEKPVGVDVELVPSPDAFLSDELVGAHANERSRIEALPAGSRPRAFAQCWARKEAYLKGRGTGLGLDPSGVRTGIGAAFGDPGPSVDQLRGWTIIDLEASWHAAAAVAIRLPSSPRLKVVAMTPETTPS